MINTDLFWLFDDSIYCCNCNILRILYQLHGKCISEHVTTWVLLHVRVWKATSERVAASPQSHESQWHQPCLISVCDQSAYKQSKHNKLRAIIPMSMQAMYGAAESTNTTHTQRSETTQQPTHDCKPTKTQVSAAGQFECHRNVIMSLRIWFCT